MKHAVISTLEGSGSEKIIEAREEDGKALYLTEKEYSEEELDLFHREAQKWIVECKGSRYFLADSDSGEDATAYYCGYFDLDPEKAVFDEEKFAGFYLCTDGMRYSGNGRYNFGIDKWGFPGYDLFGFAAYGSKTHVFLFSEAETHEWGDWTLLIRDPEKEYESYLDF